MLSSPLVSSDSALLAALAAALPEHAPVGFREGREWSHSLAEVEFHGGQSLVVKRARYDWEASRFQSSVLAASLLNRRTGVVAPRHVPILGTGDKAVEAYWRIELPTLKELWPGLSEHRQRQALRSWGELVRRVHKVKMPGHGLLSSPGSLEEFLQRDLLVRLAPALAGMWPRGYECVVALAALIPELCHRVGSKPAVLIHNDMHMANVLCTHLKGRARCVGVIDLEAAFAGPPEADLAHMQVLHGPLFGQPLDGEWFGHVATGYKAKLDEFVLGFFRAMHMINLAYHGVTLGHVEHAAVVADTIEGEISLLQR